jgi:hypothetical protein
LLLDLANRRLRTVEDFEHLTGRIRQTIIDSAPQSGPAGLRTRFWEAAVERAYDVCVYLDFVPDLRPQWRWFGWFRRAPFRVSGTLTEQ